MRYFFLLFQSIIFIFGCLPLWANSCNVEKAVTHWTLASCYEHLTPDTLAIQDLYLQDPANNPLLLIDAAPKSWQWALIKLNMETQLDNSVLTLGLPDAYNLRVWQKKANKWEIQLSLDAKSRFSDRPIQQPSLALAVNSLDEGEESFLIAYKTHGKTPLYPELHTQESYQKQTTLKHLSNGVLLGILLMLVPIILFYQSGKRYRFYIPLLLSNLLFISQVEGYNFMFLWPNHLHWNMNAPALIASLVLIFHIRFATDFLQLSIRMPRLYKIHQQVFIAACLLMLVQCIKPNVEAAMAVVVAYTFLALYTACQALRLGVPAAKFYFLGTLSLIIFTAAVLIAGITLSQSISGINLLSFPKLGYLFESLFFAAAVVAQLRQLRREQDEMRIKRLAETEQLLQAEQARLKALALAEEKQLTLATASHDIAQPLASIGLALAALSPTDGEQHIAQHIEKNVRYAQTLLKDILNQSRDSKHTASEPIHIIDLQDQLYQEFASQALAKGLSLTIIPSRLSVKGSHIILHRILNNLLSNALRYTKKGRIVLGVRRRKNALEIQVLDTGIGIAPAAVKKITEPFLQAETSAEGYGLGLFIVKNLCKESGYLLKVYSTPGRGSCFSVCIPLI